MKLFGYGSLVGQHADKAVGGELVTHALSWRNKVTTSVQSDLQDLSRIRSDL